MRTSEPDSVRKPHPFIVERALAAFDAENSIAKTLAGASVEFQLLQHEHNVATATMYARDSGVSTYVTRPKPTTPSGNARDFILRAMVEQFAYPVLEARTVDEVAEFWREHLRDFRSALKALLWVQRSAPNATDDEAVVSEGVGPDWFANRAEGLGGDDVALAVRRGMVDLDRAALMVHQFKTVQPPDAEQDTRLAADYNASRTLAMAGVVVLSVAAAKKPKYPATTAEAIKTMLGDAPRTALLTAKVAIENRGMEESVELGLLASGWSRPCEGMFRYVAEWHAPALANYIWDESLSVGLRARAVDAISSARDSASAEEILRSIFDRGAKVHPLMQECAVYAAGNFRGMHDRLRKLANETGRPDSVHVAASEMILSE